MNIERDTYTISGIRRADNGAIYDLTKSNGEQTELYALDYSDTASFLSNSLGVGYLKVGKKIEIVTDKHGNKLVLFADYYSHFLKDKLTLQGDKIDARFSYNVQYIEQTYGLVPSEFVRYCKNDEIVKLTKKY